MKVITQATEKRINDMVKREHKYGDALLLLLDDMKAREGWLGSSIKEMKSYNVELENATQIHVRASMQTLYNNLNYRFHEYFSASFCLDLASADIYDFNALVKAVDAMEYDGWC